MSTRFGLEPEDAEETMNATVQHIPASQSRLHTRMTRVTFDDGRTVDFLDRMPKGEAIKQAIEYFEREASR